MKREPVGQRETSSRSMGEKRGCGKVLDNPAGREVKALTGDYLPNLEISDGAKAFPSSHWNLATVQ